MVSFILLNFWITQSFTTFFRFGQAVSTTYSQAELPALLNMNSKQLTCLGIWRQKQTPLYSGELGWARVYSGALVRDRNRRPKFTINAWAKPRVSAAVCPQNCFPRVCWLFCLRRVCWAKLKFRLAFEVFGRTVGSRRCYSGHEKFCRVCGVFELQILRLKEI